MNTQFKYTVCIYFFSNDNLLFIRSHISDLVFCVKHTRLLLINPSCYMRIICDIELQTKGKDQMSILSSNSPLILSFVSLLYCTWIFILVILLLQLRPHTCFNSHNTIKQNEWQIVLLKVYYTAMYPLNLCVCSLF